jgi:hypothetical protein
MKQFAIITLAVIGLTCGAFAQAGYDMNISVCSFGVSRDTPGNYEEYFTAGAEVWYKNDWTGADVGTLNAYAGSPNRVGEAYNRLVSLGFTRTTTFNRFDVIGGGFELGDVRNFGPNGGPQNLITLTMVMWEGGWDLSTSTRSGLLSWVQPVNNFVTCPSLGDPWFADAVGGFSQQDLVLVVPEPSTFALTGLGAATLLACRRRK